MKARNTAYWITTALVAFSFFFGGTAYLLRIDTVMQNMAELGYPAYFVTILGAWKILGALTILAPRLPRAKEWAYAGIALNLSAGALSHIAVGHSPLRALVPLLPLGLAVASWALRPASRRLAGAPAEPVSERASGHAPMKATA